MIEAFQPDDVVIGGGNAKKLKTLPKGCRLGNNLYAFIGGFRLFEKPCGPTPARRGKVHAAAEGRWSRTLKDRVAMSIGTVNAAGAGRLTEQPAWKALEEHHRNIRAVHLRELFARDPGRGERLTAGGRGRLSRLLEEPDHRRDAWRCSSGSRRTAACAPASTPCSGATRSTSRRIEPCSTWRCAHRAARRSWSTARTSCPTCMPCSTGWRTSPIAFAAEHGPGTRASGSATSSTSASAVPISGRSWPMRRCRHYSDRSLTLPVRLEHRRHRLRRSGPRSRPGR